MRRTLLGVGIGIYLLFGGMTFAQAQISATFVKSAFATPSASSGGAQFDAASLTVFVDPSIAKWIAWNDTPTVSLTNQARPGELFLGPGGIGVDDFLRLSITNLQSNQTLTQDIDQNDGFAVSFGTQNVIFGSAPAAPDVIRDPGGFGGPTQFLDDPPSHNAIFTGAGNYRFDFSFRNVYGSSAAHPDIWLLAAVPEPQTVWLAIPFVILTMGSCRSRHVR